MSHVAQLFHSQALSSVKHCLLLFSPLPKGSTNRVTMTRSQTAHTTSDAEMAGSGLSFAMTQSFLFLLLPASAHSITRGSRNLGFFSAAIFTRQIKGVWQGSARADTYAHSLPRNHICAAISPRHQQPD